MTSRRRFSLVLVVAIAGLIAACQSPSYTVAALRERGVAMNGRRAALHGEVTNPQVPRTRRAVHLADAAVELQAFELRDDTGRLVVWYDPSQLDAPLQRGDRIEIDAQVTVPQDTAGAIPDMVVVARGIQRLAP